MAKTNSENETSTNPSEMKIGAPAGKVKMMCDGIIRFIPKNRVDEYKKLGYTVM
jgi:hypothetical protein